MFNSNLTPTVQTVAVDLRATIVEPKATTRSIADLAFGHNIDVRIAHQVLSDGKIQSAIIANDSVVDTASETLSVDSESVLLKFTYKPTDNVDFKTKLVYLKDTIDAILAETDAMDMFLNQEH